MGRLPRKIATPCCYHITHRCQERKFLLKFEIDRQNYIRRLRQGTKLHDVDVLDYMVTSNHIHLLLWSAHAKKISAFMQYLAGNSSRDYNRRKKREGAFWRGRYHPTMIQDGDHLARCLLYIDLNMVRAGACEHPRQWKTCGYHELSATRERYRAINQNRLLDCLRMDSIKQFRSWYDKTIQEKVCYPYQTREAVWSEAMAIGSRDWLDGLTTGLRFWSIKPINII